MRWAVRELHAEPLTGIQRRVAERRDLKGGSALDEGEALDETGLLPGVLELQGEGGGLGDLDCAKVYCCVRGGELTEGSGRGLSEQDLCFFNRHTTGEQ